MRRLFAFMVAAMPAVSACGGDDSAGAAAAAPKDVSQAGPHGVAHATLHVTDTARMRELEVTVWYPTAPHGPGVAAAELYPAGARRDTLTPLFAAAPAECVRKQTTSIEGATPVAGPLPLVMFSHCSGCFRTSSSMLAERLASWGFVVAAPDHDSNTLFDAVNAGVTEPVLDLRRGDIVKVLDVMLDASASELPEALRGKVDAGKVGMLGHSFGAMTTGTVAWADARVKAAFAIAAPMELLGPARVADVHVPVAFLLAEEDHSIGPGGNALIRANAKGAGAPSWLGEVADAGHWSFSDIPGLTMPFMPGCGSGKRQEDTSEAFTYLNPDTARGLGARYVTAFFLSKLVGDADATATLHAAAPGVVVTER